MEKKKVLIAITKGNFGGAQKYVYEIATSLPKDIFEVAVVCGEGDLLKEKLEKSNVRVLQIKSSQRNINIKKDIDTFFEMRKILKEEKPDVLHLNSSKMGGIGSLAGRIVGIKKIIFSAHAWAFNENRNVVEKIAIFILHWITVCLSDKTIAVSEKTKNDIGWLPFVKDKIQVIYNGIEKFETLSKTEARKILSEDNSKKVILSIAELHSSKGIDVAIRGLSLLPKEVVDKISYTIAGDGEEKYKLLNLTQELNLEKVVHFLGYVKNAKNLLSGADVFLLPSRTEAFPYTILEAGICGVPTIASSVGGVPEAIKDMQNGILIHPKNPKEIAEAIIYMLNHKEKRDEFGKEIEKTVLNFFSFERMIKETISIYS